MALHIIVSNSAGPLAEHFRENIYKKRDKDELFTKEIVVVQSQGMSVWLNQQLADPIAANLDTPFLNTFADSVLKAYWPEDEKPLMTEDWMFWRIFHLLLTDLSLYPELARYVQGENQSLKACQLAEKTAAQYDNYQIYHPDLLAKWRESEADDQWQARLYRALTEEAVSRDIRFTEFEPKPGLQPKRISVFAVSSLAPLHLDFFRKLGTVPDTEVWMYYLNPSREYWSENRSKKEAVIQSAKRLFSGMDPDEGMVGNPLLTSLGRQGRDFFRYLISHEEYQFEEPQLFEHAAAEGKTDPDYQYQYRSATMLQALQEDILQNIYRNPSSKEDDPFSGKPLRAQGDEPDGSIVINSCHTELRQVEVLYDQLLKLLEDEKLEPRDILVMAPDIGIYEPYIKAVFGGEESKLRNQFTISDRSKRRQNLCADMLLKVMQLLNGKFEAGAVLELFENPELAARWHFSRQNLDDIRDWVKSLKVIWGINGEHHKQVSGAEFEEYSWEPALDRLILGCAAAADPVSENIEPVYPFDGAEGLNSKTAGDFAAFVHMLIDFHARMTGHHTLTEWCDLIQELLDMLFVSGSRNFKELAAIRGTLTLLRKQGESDVWKDWNGADVRLACYLLEKLLLPTGIQEPFLRGKITFCSLMPMRNIPMKVIAVLGLEEETFPRKDFNSGFNVVSAAGRRAALERSRSSEDRYIFLEALLAAKEHLLLFYQGHHKLTGKELAPAVPVKELIDTLNATFPAWRNKYIRNQCLRSFDPVYFQGKKDYYSYSEKNFSAAQVVCGEMPAARGLLTEKMKDGALPQIITPEQLVSFFQNPCEYYLDKVLHLGKEYDEDSETTRHDSEPIDPDTSDCTQVRKVLLERLREQPDLLKSGTVPEQLRDFLRKTNQLAVGHIGDTELKEAVRMVQTIPAEWLGPTVPLPVSIAFKGITIEGTVDVEKNSKQLHVLAPSISAVNKNLLELYLKHLMLCASGHTGKARFCCYKKASGNTPELFVRQYLIPKYTTETEPASPLYDPGNDPSPDEVKAAKKRLAVLVDYFCKGHSRPLAFFLNAGKPQAGRTSEGNAFGSSAKEHFETIDLKDQAVKIFFELESTELEPVYNEFTAISEQVFGFFSTRREK